MLRPWFPALLFALALPVLAIACSSDDGANGDTTEEESLRIGALLPLTGALASYGEASKAVLEDAIATLNGGGGTPVELVIEDTETLPATALAKLGVLHDQGVRLVVGPYSSDEVRGVKAYADENSMVLMSPLSTSTALALPNDNLLRFTPDDAQEGVAVATLAWTEGVRALLPVTRDDEGNRGLQSGTRVVFEAFGGIILPGVTYGTAEADFPGVARTLAGLLQGAQATGLEVAIYLTAFGEVRELFQATTEFDSLRNASWIGSDSVALSAELVQDPVAAAFAAFADYPNPILGVSDTDSDLWSPVNERVRSQIGRDPDSFALAAYDSLIIGYQALERVGDESDVALRQQIVGIAAGHRGLTGSTLLNASGDRALGNYDFWGICRDGESFSWKRIATFTASTTGGAGSVRRISC